MMYKYSAFFPACILLFFVPILYPICTPCRCVMNLSLLKCNDLFSVLPLPRGMGSYYCSFLLYQILF